MQKREWTVFGILATCSVAVTLLALLYTREDGTKVGWLSYVAVVAILATLALLAVLLYFHFKQSFDRMLARNNFVVHANYVWEDQRLAIDFDSQRIANTYISTKQIIPFAEVVSYRLETYHIGANEELGDDQCFVCLVITVTKEGFETEYLYIPAFEVKVDAQSMHDVKEITAEMVNKYPELGDMLELQTDIKKIIDINIANGIHHNIIKD